MKATIKQGIEHIAGTGFSYEVWACDPHQPQMGEVRVGFLCATSKAIVEALSLPFPMETNVRRLVTLTEYRLENDTEAHKADTTLRLGAVLACAKNTELDMVLRFAKAKNETLRAIIEVLLTTAFEAEILADILEYVRGYKQLQEED